MNLEEKQQLVIALNNREWQQATNMIVAHYRKGTLHESEVHTYIRGIAIQEIEITKDLLLAINDFYDDMDLRRKIRAAALIERHQKWNKTQTV